MCEYEHENVYIEHISTKEGQLQEILSYHCFLVSKYVTILLQNVTASLRESFLWRENVSIMRLIVMRSTYRR